MSGVSGLGYREGGEAFFGEVDDPGDTDVTPGRGWWRCRHVTTKGMAMGDTTKLKQSAFAVVFGVWAVYLIVKGINVGDGSQTRDAAEASYFAGGAIVAALAVLPLLSSRS